MKKSYGYVIRAAGAKQLELITQALHKLDSESDRSAAIVAATILDTALTEALKVYLHQNTKITKEFFAITGPGGDLGPKVDLAFLVGLVNKDTWRDLVTIRDIRNKFAHRLDVSDFKSEAIATLSRNLKIAELRTFDAKTKKFPKECWMSVGNRKQILADPRERFLLTVLVLCHGLSMPGKTAMPAPAF
jgi:DNA-binding MltR family transcriptional regulator